MRNMELTGGGAGDHPNSGFLPLLTWVALQIHAFKLLLHLVLIRETAKQKRVAFQGARCIPVLLIVPKPLFFAMRKVSF